MMDFDFVFRSIEIERLLRGCLVAGVVLATYVGSAMALHRGLGLNETPAAMVAVLFAAPVSYFGHALYTFRVDLTQRSYAFRFGGSLAISFTAAWLIVNVGVERLGVPFLIGLFATTIVVPLMNYLLLRLYVFAQALRRAESE